MIEGNILEMIEGNRLGTIRGIFPVMEEETREETIHVMKEETFLEMVGGRCSKKKKEDPEEGQVTVETLVINIEGMIGAMMIVGEVIQGVLTQGL